MIKKTNLIGLCLLFVLLAFFAGCATGPKAIPHVNFDQFTTADGATMTKAAEAISFEVEVLSPSNSYDYPDLYSVPKDAVPEIYGGAKWYFEADANDKYWVYYLGDPGGDKNLLAFKVNVKNNAPHILRMEGTRIYFVPEGGQPVAPIESKNAIGEYIHHVEAQWEATRKKGLISMTYPLGFYQWVFNENFRRINLINDVGTEILPDFNYTGYLVFPLTARDIERGELIFYDIVTETDAAGNIATKTKIEFPINQENVDMWYDELAKRWKVGLPPEPVAATP